MVHVSVTGPVGGGQAGVFSDGRTDSVEVSLLKPVGSRRSCSGVRDWKSLGGQSSADWKYGSMLVDKYWTEYQPY